MKEYIQKLANEFLNEAKSSPRMFEDLAAMEHYMAESYNGRTLIELLQNADDAGSSSMCVFLYNDAIVVTYCLILFIIV